MLSALRLLGIAIAAVGALCVAFAFADARHLGVSGFNALGLISETLRPLLLALSTVLGVMSRGLYDELERPRSTPVNIRQALKTTAETPPFWLGILLSPILIIGVYGSLVAADDKFLMCLVAYENGFFFRSIVARREKHHGNQAP